MHGFENTTAGVPACCTIKRLGLGLSTHNLHTETHTHTHTHLHLHTHTYTYTHTCTIVSIEVLYSGVRGGAGGSFPLPHFFYSKKGRGGQILNIVIVVRLEIKNQELRISLTFYQSGIQRVCMTLAVKNVKSLSFKW